MAFKTANAGPDVGFGGDAVRAVGGCVRDTLLDMYDEGEAGRAKTAMPDVDLATQLLPEIVQEKLEGAGLRLCLQV